MAKHDPIRKEFFAPIEQCEVASDWLFYIGAALSVGALFVDQNQKVVYDSVSALFAISVIAGFVIGLVLRLYLLPRAEDRRRRDFFANAHGVNLASDTTSGYYNNDQTDALRRTAAQLLEDSLFTKSISRRMVKKERIRSGAYTLVWLACVVSRRTDMGLVLVASQAVFGEQILAKWLRLEWLRMRSEEVYDSIYGSLAQKSPKSTFAAKVNEALAKYETSKASAAITLSSKVFEKLNPELSLKWEKMRKTLGV